MLDMLGVVEQDAITAGVEMMSTYTLSTPEGRAEVRRLVATIPEPLDCTDGVVWTVDGRQIDDEGNYETWQEKVADTSPYYAPFFAAAPTLLLAALEEIERLERELADANANLEMVAAFAEALNAPKEPR